MKPRFYDNAHYATSNTDLLIPLILRVAGQAAKAALSPADAQRMLEDIAEARTVEAIRARNLLDMVSQAKAMGVDPKAVTPQTTKRVLQRELGIRTPPNAPASGLNRNPQHIRTARSPARCATSALPTPRRRG